MGEIIGQSVEKGMRFRVLVHPAWQDSKGARVLISQVMNYVVKESSCVDNDGSEKVVGRKGCSDRIRKDFGERGKS